MARRRRPSEGPALPRDLDEQLARALHEDRVRQDRTSRAVVPAHRVVRARIVSQSDGVLSGSRVVARLASRERLSVISRLPDGSRLTRGSVVLELRGNARRILGVERTLLNYLMHLSGVASETDRAVRAAGPRLRVLATRKTTPGLRDLEKAAVVHGGGHPHRRNLSDAFLLKGPHLLLGGIEEGVRRALRAAHGRRPVEVEVRTLDEARRAIAAGARRLLLDNVGPAGARAIVRGLPGRGSLEVEASGGITVQNVRSYRSSGVDSVSIGSLTHSARAVPFHLVLVREGAPGSAPR